jgi:hypothetical protein
LTNGTTNNLDPDDDIDAFAKASVATHFAAGALGGGVHGIAAPIWEAVQVASRHQRERTLLSIPGMILHHGLAHSMLFGSYEGLKRAALEQVTDDSTSATESITRVEYLGSVAIAGGLAGQVQHIVSHYSEQLLITAEAIRVPISALRLQPPTIRPTMFAFLPSAIAFVAFEYGRSV